MKLVCIHCGKYFDENNEKFCSQSCTSSYIAAVEKRGIEMQLELIQVILKNLVEIKLILGFVRSVQHPIGLFIICIYFDSKYANARTRGKIRTESLNEIPDNIDLFYQNFIQTNFQKIGVKYGKLA